MLQSYLNETISQPTAFFCFCCAWFLISLFCWSLWKASLDGIAQLKKLHQIPCSRCVFFTNNYRLKCTVNPLTALSEEAIACRDFEPACRLAIANRQQKFKLPAYFFLSSRYSDRNQSE